MAYTKGETCLYSHQKYEVGVKETRPDKGRSIEKERAQIKERCKMAKGDKEKRRKSLIMQPVNTSFCLSL